MGVFSYISEKFKSVIKSSGNNSFPTVVAVGNTYIIKNYINSNQNSNINSSLPDLKYKEVFLSALKQPTIEEERKIIFKSIWKFLSIKDQNELMNPIVSTNTKKQEKKKKEFDNAKAKQDVEELKLLVCLSILKNLNDKDKDDLLKEINSNDFTINEEQKDVINEEILEFVWKYLSINDKFNCTLICKRFNIFISKMDYFSLRLSLNARSIDEKHIPTLSRNYKTVLIEYYEFYSLKPRMINMLKFLSESLINLTLHCLETDIMILCSMLNELPLLESLNLECLTINYENFSLVNLPKFLHLRNLIINPFSDEELSELSFEVFDVAQNIELLELSFMTMNINVLKTFLERHKNKLNSLNLYGCHFYPIDSVNDFNIFDCLDELRVLKLTYNNQITQTILTSKCIHSLTDLEVFHYCNDKEFFNSFLQNYFKLKEINEHQLIEFDAQKFQKPIITKIKSPNSEDIITKSYNVHCCDLKKPKHFHSQCTPIPLTNLGSNFVRNENLYSFLSIKVK